MTEVKLAMDAIVSDKDFRSPSSVGCTLHLSMGLDLHFYQLIGLIQGIITGS